MIRAELVDFTPESGAAMRMRIVYRGDCYGLNMCLTHNEDDPLVEFYDRRFPHTTHGQFIARYYLRTLRTHKGGGLCLMGHVPEWSIDGLAYAALLDLTLNMI